MPTETQSFSFEKTVTAAPDQVYRAFTNSTHLRGWLSDIAIADPRPFGRIYMAWNSGFYTNGEFVELELDRKVVFTWLGRNEPGQTRVEVMIYPQGSDSRVQLKHSGVGSGDEWAKVIEEIRTGWTASLENLAALMDTGEDLRLTRRPMMGITLNDFNEEIARRLGVPVSQGIRIDTTVEGMGAQTAGLESNDVIISMGGYKVLGFSDIANALQGHRAGDELEVQFYRGPEKKTIMMTLSGRSVPTTPATVAELAEKVRARYEEINRNLDEFLANISEEEAAHQPAPGEWSIKDVLAHLIHDERGFHNYITQVVDEHEAHYDDYPSNMQFLNDAMMSVYPTLAELRQALRHATQESVELFEHLPESFREHKGSFWRLVYAALSDPYHYIAHMEQMQAALAAARETQPLAGV
jgi:uncharacterized protein YndB with AHSA1/START domain/uncharacterized damage-inducible protein DinB